MLSTKPRDAPIALILDLHCRVRLAHQAMPEQVNTVPYMAWRGHEREVLGDKPSALDGGVIKCPVIPPNPVLHSSQFPPKDQRGTPEPVSPGNGADDIQPTQTSRGQASDAGRSHLVRGRAHATLRRSRWRADPQRLCHSGKPRK